MKLFIDILNKYTRLLNYYGSGNIQQLELSEESLEELKNYCKLEDDKWEMDNENATSLTIENNKSRTIKYTDEELKKESESFKFNHDKLLPKLLNEEPQFPFNGYIFKIKIKK